MNEGGTMPERVTKTEAIRECLAIAGAIGPVTHARVSEAESELAALLRRIAELEAACEVKDEELRAIECLCGCEEAGEHCNDHHAKLDSLDAAIQRARSRNSDGGGS